MSSEAAAAKSGSTTTDWLKSIKYIIYVSTWTRWSDSWMAFTPVLENTRSLQRDTSVKCSFKATRKIWNNCNCQGSRVWWVSTTSPPSGLRRAYNRAIVACVQVLTQSMFPDLNKYAKRKSKPSTIFTLFQPTGAKLYDKSVWHSFQNLVRPKSSSSKNKTCSSTS